MNKSWRKEKFSDVVFLQEGPGIRKYEYEDGGFPMINVRCVKNGYIDMSSSKCANRDLAEGIWKHFQVEAGDILFTISGTIGRSAIVNKEDLPLLMNTSVVRFRSKIEELERNFLYYFVNTKEFKGGLLKQSTGTAIQNVGPTHIRKMNISFPALKEQKRIVAILDQAFEEIDQTIANTEKNLTNAKEIFESYLNDVFTKKGEGWEEKRLGDVCNFFNGFAFRSSDSIPNSSVQLIRMGNLYQNILDLERKPSFYPENFRDDYSEYVLEERDLIISLTGTVDKEDYGYTVEIPKTDRTLLLNQRIAKFTKINSDFIRKDFFLWVLRSRFFLDKLYKSARGTRQANLSTERMKDIILYLPPVEEQSHIDDSLKKLNEEIQNLKKVHQKKLEKLVELKQSLLQKAFSGELTKDKAA